MKGSVPIYKLYVKCPEPRNLGEALLRLGDPVSRHTLFSYPYMLVLSKYKNMGKKNRML